MSTIKVTAPKLQSKKTSLGKLAESQEKIKLALAEIKTVVADYGEMECCEDKEVTKDDLDNVYRSLYSYLDSFYSSINALSNRIYETQDMIFEKFWEHEKGHLPKILSVEQMSRAIEALGLSSEVEVQKRVIYASDGKPAKLQWEVPLK